MSITEQKPTVGFMGLGDMGSLMAQRLLQAGYPLHVYNRTPEKAQPLVEQGATLAEHPRNLAAQSQILISMLTNKQALDDLLDGANGLLAGLNSEHILIEMSTIHPDQSRQIAQAVQDRGARMIDAPVAGSTPQAKGGELLIFVGGEQELYQRCKPLLECMGQAAYYMGDHGTGAAMKLVVNTLLGVEMQAIAEALVLGQKAGLERQQLLDVLGKTKVIAPAHALKLQNAKKEDYPTQFALPLMVKDLGLIRQLASENAAPMPITSVAEQMYRAALIADSKEDFSVIQRFMEHLAGLSSAQQQEE